MTAKQAAIEAISRLPENAARADIFLAVFSYPEPSIENGASANGIADSATQHKPAKLNSITNRAAESEDERKKRIDHFYANMLPESEYADAFDPAYDLMALREMDKPQFEIDAID